MSRPILINYEQIFREAQDKEWLGLLWLFRPLGQTVNNTNNLINTKQWRIANLVSSFHTTEGTCITSVHFERTDWTLEVEGLWLEHLRLKSFAEIFLSDKSNQSSLMLHPLLMSRENVLETHQIIYWGDKHLWNTHSLGVSLVYNRLLRKWQK